MNSGRSLMNNSRPAVTLNRLQRRQKKSAPDLCSENYVLYTIMVNNSST